MKNLQIKSIPMAIVVMVFSTFFVGCEQDQLRDNKNSTEPTKERISLIQVLEGDNLNDYQQMNSSESLLAFEDEIQLRNILNDSVFSVTLMGQVSLTIKCCMI